MQCLRAGASRRSRPFRDDPPHKCACRRDRKAWEPSWSPPRPCFFDNEQHAKSHATPQHGLDSSFKMQELLRELGADQAPGLEPAAQGVSGKRKPIDSHNTKLGNEPMQSIALARDQEGRNRLI